MLVLIGMGMVRFEDVAVDRESWGGCFHVARNIGDLLCIARDFDKRVAPKLSLLKYKVVELKL